MYFIIIYSDKEEERLLNKAYKYSISTTANLDLLAIETDNAILGHKEEEKVDNSLKMKKEDGRDESTFHNNIVKNINY